MSLAKSLLFAPKSYLECIVIMRSRIQIRGQDSKFSGRPPDVASPPRPIWTPEIKVWPKTFVFLIKYVKIVNTLVKNKQQIQNYLIGLQTHHFFNFSMYEAVSDFCSKTCIMYDILAKKQNAANINKIKICLSNVFTILHLFCDEWCI